MIGSEAGLRFFLSAVIGVPTTSHPSLSRSGGRPRLFQCAPPPTPAANTMPPPPPPSAPATAGRELGVPAARLIRGALRKIVPPSNFNSSYNTDPIGTRNPILRRCHVSG